MHCTIRSFAFLSLLFASLFLAGIGLSYADFNYDSCRDNGYDNVFSFKCVKNLGGNVAAWSSTNSYSIDKCTSGASVVSCPATYTAPANDKCIEGFGDSDNWGGYKYHDSSDTCRLSVPAELSNDSYSNILITDTQKILSVMDNDTQNDSHPHYWKIESVNNTNSCFTATINGTGTTTNKQIKIYEFDSGTTCKVNHDYTFTYQLQSHYWSAWCQSGDIKSNNKNAIFGASLCGYNGDDYIYEQTDSRGQQCKISRDYFTSCSFDATANALAPPPTATVTIKFTCPAGQNDNNNNGSCVANNTAPTISAQTFTVAENQTAVGTITANDDDASDTLTYSISGTDSGEFSIDSSTGVLTFETDKKLNFENKTFNHTIAKIHTLYFYYMFFVIKSQIFVLKT